MKKIFLTGIWKMDITWFHLSHDCSASSKNSLINVLLFLSEFSIDWKGACDIWCVAIVLSTHVKQTTRPHHIVNIRKSSMVYKIWTIQHFYDQTSVASGCIYVYLFVFWAGLLYLSYIYISCLVRLLRQFWIGFVSLLLC